MPRGSRNRRPTFEQILAKEKLLGNPESAPEGLAGTSWKLVRFQGGDEKILTPDDPSKYTLEFLADGKLAARIDCNRGTGTWTSEGPNQLELGPLGLTRMACPPSPVSDRILKDWSYVRSYVLKDGRLFVSLMADGGIYEFEPLGRQASATTRAAPPLEGTYWKLIRLGDVSVAAPSSKREPHLTLDAQARRVTGSGGCNRVTGSYEVNGDRLSFSRMARTKMACVDGMENETDFLKALEQAKTWRIDG